MNCTGPMSEIRGTPYFTLPLSDSLSFTVTIKSLSVRYVLNQNKANPVKERFLDHTGVYRDLRYQRQRKELKVLECCMQLLLYCILNHCILCMIQFQRSGTVFAQI